MRRREFIRVLGGAAAAWPVGAQAQQPAMPVIGFINSGSPDPSRHQLAGFRLGLNETGYVEGRNCEIEYRWAEGQDDRLPVLVADLVSRQVAVIVANTPSALAAKRATATVPIVFTTGTDPISLGLVPNLNRPGGNVTGVSFFSNKLEAKRLGLLHELVPSAARIAYLIDPRFPDAAIQMRDIQEAARELGLEITVESASTERDIDTVFQTLVLKRVDALLVGAGPFFNSRRDHIVALAARHALPAMYEWREFAEKGGLAAYGTSLTDSYRQAGIYAGRILKGVKPADLPVLQPTKFVLLINLNTAKTLGLTPSAGLLAIADEVIE
jgi:putative ABC transport system substrate-binding protein